MKSFFPPQSTSILSYFLKSLTWSLPNDNNTIYLTFDDGPIPEITPWILNLLQQKKINATFFCIGKNVEKHPDIYQQIIKEGHTIGNHSYSHLSGWKTENNKYYEDISLASKYISSSLFRPPYGEIGPLQIQHLKQKYKIIMWDVLSKDYDTKISPIQCYDNVVDNVKSGSIIVMHDSLKAENNVKNSLEKIIDTLHEKGFNFENLK